MIHLPHDKLKQHDLYEIIFSVLASRYLCMQDKKGARSFPSLPQTDVVIKLIKMTQEIFQSEPSLLRLEFGEMKESEDKRGSDDENNNSDVYIVVGDLHGNFDDLLRIFEDNSYPPDTKYIFTGDYIDRGTCSVEIMLLLFSLKNLYPNHIFLLRGNHECQDICSVYGFQNECEIKFPNSSPIVHNTESGSSNIDDSITPSSSTPVSLSPSINDNEEKSTTNEPNSNNDNDNENTETANDNPNNDGDNENHTKDNAQTNFFDLEINLNSISLPTLFSTPPTPNENTEPLKTDIENDYFNFENYHYFNIYNDSDQNFNNSLINNDSFITQKQIKTPTNKVFEAFTEAFTYMPFAAVVADQIFCVHGGISPDIQYIEQIENINRPCLASDYLVTNGILWSDPRTNLPIGDGTGNGFEPSDRGTGYLFNDIRLNIFLQENNLTYLIRSHEPCQNGINKVFGETGRCITVFSNSDYCGMDNIAAVVKLTPKYNTNETENPSSSSSSSSSSQDSRSESPDSVNSINNVVYDENQNNDNNDNNYEKNNDVSIIVQNFNNADNNNYKESDKSFINDNESVSISFRFYEPLNRDDLLMRKIIIPEWIFENSSSNDLKENYQENDIFNSIIDEPVDLFYTGI